MNNTETDVVVDERGAETKVPFFGVVYGEIVYWLAIIGTVVGIVGAVSVLSSPGSEERSRNALASLWAGEPAARIWADLADGVGMGHWYLKQLHTGNGLAMFGVAICCVAAVVGMCGGCIAMFTGRGREGRLYKVLAIVVLIVLSLSVVGIVSG